MTRLLIIAVSLLLPYAAISQTDTTVWTVQIGKTPAGYLKQFKNTDGTFTELFKFNDRGRGDSTVTHYRMNEKGIITWIDGNGVDYLKRRIFERYQISHGLASWENTTEKESGKVDSVVEYIPLDLYAGTSYQAYFDSPGQTLQLLPNGTRKLEVIHEHIAGENKLRLISLTGTGTKPSYEWIGHDNNLFASTGGWMVTIRSGYEKFADTLASIQDRYERDYFKTLATKLRKTIPTGIAVTHATLFDGTTNSTRANTTILIRDGIIQEVNTNNKVPAGYSVIDAQGKFVMPGLWDMHVHYTGGTHGLLNLSCGVTNVRDMGNDEMLLQRKREIEERTVLGPTIQSMCGFIDGAGQYSGPIGYKISSVEEGIAAVKAYKDKGYAQIKLYSSLKPEWVKAIAAEAHRHGMRVSGHIPAHMIASEAIEDGFDEIHHMNMLFLNFLGKELDTRTPLRFHAVAQNAAKIDLNSAEVQEFIALLKSKGTVIDPTVSFFEPMFVRDNGKVISTMHPVLDRLPLEVQRRFKSGGSLEIPEGQDENYKMSFDKMLQLIRMLFENHVTIVPGTDDYPGFVLHKELENYSRAGIPNTEVLKIATIVSARVAGKDKLYGTIERGKVADLIIIDGNPINNISDIRNVQTIIKGQDVFESKDLLGALSIKYFK